MRQDGTIQGEIWGFLKPEGGRAGGGGSSGNKGDFAITRPPQRGWRHCKYVREGVKQINNEGGGGAG